MPMVAVSPTGAWRRRLVRRHRMYGMSTAVRVAMTLRSVVVVSAGYAI